MLDKTFKLPVYTEAAKSDVAKSDAAQAKPVEDKKPSQELAIKAQLEEEKSKSLEHLKTIVQLRESLKQEKAKTAELEAKAKELAVQEAKIKELTEALNKISNIAAAAR